MSPAARSVFIFGIYVVAAGLGLAVAPALLLGPLGFPAPADGWVRVVGVTAAGIGYFHIAGARGELTAYFRTTVTVRFGIALAFVALVAAGLVPPPLIVFAVVEVLGAVWTLTALRSQKVVVTT